MTSKATQGEIKSPVDPKVIESQLSPADKAVVDMGATKLHTAPLTDADVIEGFNLTQEINVDPEPTPVADQPGEGADSDKLSPSVPVPSPDKSVVPEIPSAAVKTYKVGAREFGSADELAAYVSGLEQSKLDLLDAFQVPADTMPADPDPSEILFEDPKRAVEILRKQIREEIAATEHKREQISKAESARKRTWDSFYAKNPDFVGFEEIVEHQLNALVAEKGSNVSLETGLPLLAERTRARVNKMRETLKPAETISHSVAVTGGSTPAQVPVVKSEPVTTSFIQELKDNKKRA